MSWSGYLKLFLTALYKLLPHQGTVWRGVTQDLSANYYKNDEQVWWAFSSCTSSLDILASPNFLGDTDVHTLFTIEVFNGRLISDFSEHATEDEILLLPGTHLRGVSNLKPGDELHIIHLKQIEPSYFSFDPLEQVDLKLRHASPFNQPQKEFSSSEISNEGYSSFEDYDESQSKHTLLLKQWLMLITI
jgi:hypothetical protein